MAALVAQAATNPRPRGQALELGGPENLTFNEYAAVLQEAAGLHGAVRHIPRAALWATAWTAAAVNPALARQARAALAMDTLDMTFDSRSTRRAFPDLPETSVRAALDGLGLSASASR